MKTLKLKMQDLTNPTILTHHEIKNIMGGSGANGDSCRISYYINASLEPITIYYPFNGTCGEQSEKANQTCLEVLGEANSSSARCSYDCSCDGWHQ